MSKERPCRQCIKWPARDGGSVGDGWSRNRRSLLAVASWWSIS